MNFRSAFAAAQRLASVAPLIRTAGGVSMLPETVRSMISRYLNPIATPADIVPPSVLARGEAGTAVHLVADRRAAPQHPGEGKVCEDCLHFRYEAGQERIRRHGMPLLDDPRWGSRGIQLRRADFGVCAAQDTGEELTHRFHGCPRWQEAGAKLSTADPRRGRRFEPIRW